MALAGPQTINQNTHKRTRRGQLAARAVRGPGPGGPGPGGRIARKRRGLAGGPRQIFGGPSPHLAVRTGEKKKKGSISPHPAQSPAPGPTKAPTPGACPGTWSNRPFKGSTPRTGPERVRGTIPQAILVMMNSAAWVPQSTPRPAGQHRSRGPAGSEGPGKRERRPDSRRTCYQRGAGRGGRPPNPGRGGEGRVCQGVTSTGVGRQAKKGRRGGLYSGGALIKLQGVPDQKVSAWGPLPHLGHGFSASMNRVFAVSRAGEALPWGLGLSAGKQLGPARFFFFVRLLAKGDAPARGGGGGVGILLWGIGGRGAAPPQASSRSFLTPSRGRPPHRRRGADPRHRHEGVGRLAWFASTAGAWAARLIDGGGGAGFRSMTKHPRAIRPGDVPDLPPPTTKRYGPHRAEEIKTHPGLGAPNVAQELGTDGAAEGLADVSEASPGRSGCRRTASSASEVNTSRLRHSPTPPRAKPGPGTQPPPPPFPAAGCRRGALGAC